MRVTVILLVFSIGIGGPPTCGQQMPVPGGSIVRSFEPLGRFGGHWGVDIAAPVGSTVQAISPGTVSFSGTVAGVMSVTIAHGRGLKTSYSYLNGKLVSVGDRIKAGAAIGVSGVDHGVGALHLSLRRFGQYVDPMFALSCGTRSAVHPFLAPEQP